MVKFISFILFTCCVVLPGKEQQQNSIIEMDLGLKSSIRGLSVVDDKVAWFSGSGGWTGVTVDGGETWKTKQIKNFEKTELRSLYAFNDKKAIVANVGSPANILITLDGGDTWKTVYTNNLPEAFIDGIDFWNDNEGVVYGDPINNKMLLIETLDGGLTWKEFAEAIRPKLNQGEASFAASGTGIRCMPDNQLLIATGGITSRLWLYNLIQRSWSILTPPIIQGEEVTGIFSVAANDKTMIVVGGNYKIDSLKVDHVFYSNDFGKTWQKPSKVTRGYRECIEFLGDNKAIAVGPSGFDFTIDNGVTWNQFSDLKSYHVLRKARKGSLVLAAGNDKIAVVK